jgi:hypothetical protein
MATTRINEDGRKITTDGLNRVTYLQKSGRGKKRGKEGMHERIWWDDGYHSNRCYEKAERTQLS